MHNTCYEPSSNDHVYFRPLQPGDYQAVKALHQELFPIDYDETFFNKAVTSADRLFSVAAIASWPDGRSQLIGCITARSMYAYECDPVDRHYLGLSSPAVASTPLVYILTLGVSRSWQKRGVARALLQHVHQHAQAMRWYLVYLHVITYNEAAIQLYGSQSYQRLACLQNFYTILTGRTPDPSRSHYDAYIYACQLQSDHPAMANSLIGWSSQVAWNMAMAPLRNVLGHFNACMPWVNCRHGWRPAPPPGHGPNPCTPGISSHPGHIGHPAGSCEGPPPPSLPPQQQKTIPVMGSQQQHASQQQGTCQPGMAPEDLNGMHWQQSGTAAASPFVAHAAVPRRRTAAGVEDVWMQNGAPGPPARPPGQHTLPPTQAMCQQAADDANDKNKPRQSFTLLQWLTTPGYGRG